MPRETSAEKRQRERLAKAVADLRRIEEELAPFASPRVFRDHSTAGEWRETASSVTKSAAQRQSRR